MTVSIENKLPIAVENISSHMIAHTRG